ncbi:phosphotransferase enzyme family protein [Ornithinibacillus scapharcae]|uniref:phosphotransferase enzyme family protein n=1 Tax=Ornithinibacillus scapharcae TaxID=1147159 RepID=UPI000225BAA6|nr:phosphotransferase [Ornithinibacillus scapharcae]
MTHISEQSVLEDLFNQVHKLFGFQLLKAEQIRRGWLNLKWKIDTDHGTYLLKQYNKERLKKYSISDLRDVFLQQNRLHELSFPCPKILTKSDETLFQSRDGDHFILMEYCEGDMVRPGKFTEEQMYQLGEATGKLHFLLNDGVSLGNRAPQFRIPSKPERISYWHSVHEEIKQKGKLNLLPIMEKQIHLTERFPIDSMNYHRIGWAHRDLWADNILFEQENPSAIIDFDRLSVDYLMLDIGRAVISGALDEGHFQVRNASAFMEGYRVHQKVGQNFLRDSLLLLWYLESTWWLDSAMDERKGPPKRFVQEMIWLSEHLVEIEEIVEGL